MAELGAPGEARLAFGAASVEILRTAERLRADLIVVGAHRPAFFADLVLGVNITRIARHATQPLLLVSGDAKAPYASVVAGVDFSAHARRALQVAAAMAPTADICALHTYHINFKGYQTGGHDGETARILARPIEESAAKEMNAFLASSGVDPARIVARIVEEDPAAGLRQQVASQKADLVAIGAHGHSGLARAFLGSLAEEMLMNPPCDVLVTRGGVRE
jgi:nucleotide-binding universal stress UspA family protein